MSAEKKFLVSVADAYIIDTDTDIMVLKGKAMLNSSIEQAMQNQEIYAGKGSQLQFEYNYQKVLNYTIEDAEFNESYICMQNNSTISQALADFYTSEFVLLDSTGKGELAETPVGNVYVKMDNGQHLTVTPNGKEVVVAGMEDKEVEIAYRYKTSTDEIVIDASTFPKTYKLVLNGDLFTNRGKYAEMQITTPKFKPDGALAIGLTHDAVASQSLNGKALADNRGNYAYINFKYIDQADIPLQYIAATPSEIQLDSSVTGDSEQLTIYGIRGGMYNNILIDPTDCTLTSDDTDVATVSPTGLIEIGTNATSGQSTLVKVAHGSHVDVVSVEII